VSGGGRKKRLEEKGFRVDSGNKMPSGWWLTATAGSRQVGKAYLGHRKFQDAVRYTELSPTKFKKLSLG
jgi:hypothetical protein